MRARIVRHSSVAVAALIASCQRTPSRLGLDEPIRIREGVFHPGELPGSAPDPDAGVTAGTAEITSLENASGIVQWREAGKALGGRSTREAYSIAMRFPTLGSGYWVVPVGAIDATQNGERVWSVTADFGEDIPTGTQHIRFVAIDGEGHAGRQRELEVCVIGPIPDNLHACDATRAAPSEIFSLSWDTDVDLDLRVQTPDGKWVEWKHPSTAIGDGGRIDRTTLALPETGILDRDSNGECVIDSIRRENLVWQGAPRAGTYRVYASLYNACGLAAVNWQFVHYHREGDPDAGDTQTVERDRVAGTLTGAAANGGATPGTFVTEITFP